MFWSCNYVWREKVKINSMELVHLSKLVPLELQYVHRRGWASASIASWKLSNKLLMDIFTIYYWYSIQILTWDIKNLKKNIFFICQPYLAIQWSSMHEIIRGPMCMVDKKNGVACANYYVQKLWCLTWFKFQFQMYSLCPLRGQVLVSKV